MLSLGEGEASIRKYPQGIMLGVFYIMKGDGP